MKKSELVPVAEELNEVLGLEPKIDAKKLSLTDLKKKIIKASTLIEPGDTFSEKTMGVFKELDITIGDPDDDETIVLDEEDDAEEVEEVDEPTKSASGPKPGKETPRKSRKPVTPPKAEKTEKTEKATSNLPKHEGSMAQFMDSVLIKGGTWENITTEVQAEAEDRGLDPKKYATGVIRAHAKFRVNKGTLDLAIDTAGVTPSGSDPAPKAKAKKAKK